MALTADDKDDLQELFQGLLDQYDAQLGKRLDELIAYKVSEAVKPLLDPLDQDQEPETVTVGRSKNGNGHSDEVPGKQAPYTPEDPAPAAAAQPGIGGIATWLGTEGGQTVVKLVTELVGMFKPNQANVAQAVEQMVKGSAPMMDVWNNGANFASTMYTYAARATGQVPDASKIDWTNPLNSFGVGPNANRPTGAATTSTPIDISAEVKRLAQNNVPHAEPAGAAGAT